MTLGFLLYSCGPSVCQCAEYYEYRAKGSFGQNPLWLDPVDDARDCADTAVEEGVTARRGSTEFVLQAEKILRKECDSWF